MPRHKGAHATDRARRKAQKLIFCPRVAAQRHVDERCVGVRAAEHGGSEGLIMVYVMFDVDKRAVW